MKVTLRLLLSTVDAPASFFFVVVVNSIPVLTLMHYYLKFSPYKGIFFFSFYVFLLSLSQYPLNVKKYIYINKK